MEIEVKAVAFLEEEQDEIGAIIASLASYQSPYWHIERSREGTSRSVAVELVVNGEAVESKSITADGGWQDVNFNYSITSSSWVAVRIYGSSHSNPIFIELNDEPILRKESAEWCREAVDQCWKMKKDKFRKSEMEAAKKGYDHARAVYDRMIRG